MFFALPFPMINPVAIAVGPIAIRWYALAYIVGILLGWFYAKKLAGKAALSWGWNPKLIEDFVTYATLGVILGGRLGYVLFYKPMHYLQNPGEILQVWNGGMAFHGGALGVIVAIIIFARVKKLPVFGLGDIVCAVVPIGLGLGRIANFVNGELYGRATDVAWAMVFPHDEKQVLRHPSQLYQAAMEGLILFLVLLVLEKKGMRKYPGVISGTFLAGYGVARFIGEFFREPDSFLGLLTAGLSMGQLLSLPMIAVGAFIIRQALQGSFAPARPAAATR
ncbi:prolipoprotein diacylglyceryl transferase [Lacibacterium aquatile]|uniref:Phosphatidylglycerol--prolipoprotein diacylglyceryl transferase n=1 Tax=Lacibacterium aquatile TaxID=1168082 RepID=A0ABW5DVC1_9PROT